MDKEWVLTRIKRYEGLCLRPYKCPAGHLTIGYGHNLDAGITPVAAEALLKADVQAAENEVRRAFPWFLKLDSARQFVLVDICFNMGLARMKTFKKMLAACEAGNYERAAKEMLDSKWAFQVGRRAVENAEMMRTGRP